MILGQRFYLRISTGFSMSGVNFAYYSYEKPLRTAHSKKIFRHLTPIYIFLGPVTSISDIKPIIFEVKPYSELIINSVLEHFTYLKFRNNFRRIDNNNFAFAQLTMPYLHWKTWKL